MNIILTILIGFPLGYLIRSRGTAVLAYVILDGYLFTFQTAFLLMQWVDGDTHAFGPRGRSWSPEKTTQFISYLVLNGVIVAIGIGLVLLGHKVRARRTNARDTVTAS
ncbi:MAG TPA: hypothetical protein VMT27_09015 [Actinomycetes bacterium]|nr:hypothetical protein [Actinomycetes bacterium]